MNKKIIVFFTSSIIAVSAMAAMPMAMFDGGIPSLYQDTVTRSSHPKQKDNKVGSKEGKACRTSVLMIYNGGDSSIATASKNGGLTQVFTVDQDNFSLLFFLYSKKCTIVHGE